VKGAEQRRRVARMGLWIDRRLQLLPVNREFDRLHQMLSSAVSSEPRLIWTDRNRHVRDCHIRISVSLRPLAETSASTARDSAAEWDGFQLRSPAITASVWASRIGAPSVAPRNARDAFPAAITIAIACVNSPVWSTHHLARRRQVRISELKDEPFLMLTSDPKTHVSAQIGSIFKAAGFSPSVVMETNFFRTMIELVSRGSRFAIVPTTIRDLNVRGVRLIEFKDVQTEAGMDFIWREGSISPPLLNLIRVIKRHTTFAKVKLCIRALTRRDAKLAMSRVLMARSPAALQQLQLSRSVRPSLPARVPSPY
jgi:LysR substrate binding domain